MTEPSTEPLADTDPTEVGGPPLTDDAAIDDALLGLGELAATPVTEHHDRLAEVHEVLHSALDRADPASDHG